MASKMPNKRLEATRGNPLAPQAERYASNGMKSINAPHPFFERVELSGAECCVSLSGAFPIHGFRLEVVEPLSDLVEVAADIGFRHEDGAVDWIRGSGHTIEEAAVDALQHFLNLVAFPENLSDKLVRRDAIA